MGKIKEQQPAQAVAKSNRELRLARQKKSRIVLYLICAVLLLLLLSSIVFLFCHAAFVLSASEEPTAGWALPRLVQTVRLR